MIYLVDDFHIMGGRAGRPPVLGDLKLDSSQIVTPEHGIQFRVTLHVRLADEWDRMWQGQSESLPRTLSVLEHFAETLNNNPMEATRYCGLGDMRWLAGIGGHYAAVEVRLNLIHREIGRGPQWNSPRERRARPTEESPAAISFARKTLSYSSVRRIILPAASTRKPI